MRGYLQSTCLLLVLSALLCIPFCAAAQSGPYAEIGPDAPMVGDEVFITLHSNDDGLAMVYLVGGPNASVSFQRTTNIENGSAVVGPFILSEGNYSLRVIFWHMENGSLNTSYYEMEFSVVKPADRYDALFVVIVGISIVFVTLGILTVSTYLTGKLMGGEEPAAEARGGGGAPPLLDDAEKIAVIATALRSRGD